MKKKKVFVALAVDPGTRDLWTLAAREAGISRSALLRRGAARVVDEILGAGELSRESPEPVKRGG